MFHAPGFIDGRIFRGLQEHADFFAYFSRIEAKARRARVACEERSA